MCGVTDNLELKVTLLCSAAKQQTVEEVPDWINADCTAKKQALEEVPMGAGV